jgi:hypothetical protein
MSTVLITGANRGIGFGIAQAVASRIPSSTIILGCRKIEKGHEAIGRLRELGVSCPLDAVQIDIEDIQSITAAVEALDKNYGKLDGSCVPNCLVWSSKSTKSHAAISANQQCRQPPAAQDSAPRRAQGLLQPQLQQLCHGQHSRDQGLCPAAQEELLAESHHDLQRQRKPWSHSKQRGNPIVFFCFLLPFSVSNSTRERL